VENTADCGVCSMTAGTGSDQPCGSGFASWSWLGSEYVGYAAAHLTWARCGMQRIGVKVGLRFDTMFRLGFRRLL